MGGGLYLPRLVLGMSGRRICFRLRYLTLLFKFTEEADDRYTMIVFQIMCITLQ